MLLSLHSFRFHFLPVFSLLVLQHLGAAPRFGHLSSCHQENYFSFSGVTATAARWALESAVPVNFNNLDGRRRMSWGCSCDMGSYQDGQMMIELSVWAPISYTTFIQSSFSCDHLNSTYFKSNDMLHLKVLIRDNSARFSFHWSHL